MFTFIGNSLNMYIVIFYALVVFILSVIHFGALSKTVHMIKKRQDVSQVEN